MIRVGFEIPPKRQAILPLLDALVSLNRLELKHYRLPSIYKAGVRYLREPKGKREQWKTIRQILKDKHGDCEDLAAARSAELQQRGINARPWLKKKGNIWHVVVRYPDGRIEDPSRLLGMGSI